MQLLLLLQVVALLDWVIHRMSRVPLKWTVAQDLGVFLPAWWEVLVFREVWQESGTLRIRVRVTWTV